MWESPRQGRCPPALSAKLWLTGSLRPPWTLCGKKRLKPAGPHPFLFPIGHAHGGPTLTIPGGDREASVLSPLCFPRRAVHLLLHRTVGQPWPEKDSRSPGPPPASLWFPSQALCWPGGCDLWQVPTGWTSWLRSWSRRNRTGRWPFAPCRGARRSPVRGWTMRWLGCRYQAGCWHLGSPLGCWQEGPSGRDPRTPSPAHVLPVTVSCLMPAFCLVPSM